MADRAADPAEPIRVFVMDDHDQVREQLCEIIELDEGLDLVGQAASARHAFDAIPRLSPDVAVLDLRLPDGSGVEVCRAVRRVAPTVQGLLLTSVDGDQALLAAVCAGAAGVLVKRIRGLDLPGVLRQIAAGQRLLDPGHSVRMLRDARARLAGHHTRSLDQIEGSILDLIGEGLTDTEIGTRLGLVTSVASAHVRSVLRKLEVAGITGSSGFAIAHQQLR